MIKKLRFKRFGLVHGNGTTTNNQTTNIFQGYPLSYKKCLGWKSLKKNNCKKTYFLNKMHLIYLAHFHHLKCVLVHFLKNCSSALLSSITKSNCSDNSLSSAPRTRKHTKQRHSHFKVWLIWHHISPSKTEKYGSSKKIQFSTVRSVRIFEAVSKVDVFFFHNLN